MTFARLANGNVQPTRIIKGHNTKLSRTMHGIAYNEKHDEIVVPVALAGGILTFKGDAKGSDAPIRVIQGPKTRILGPDTLYMDAVHDEIVSDSGNESILVFPRLAEGDVAPLREIGGPKTHLSNIFGVAVDPVRNLIVVANREDRPREDERAMMEKGEWTGDELLIFDRLAEGDVVPKAIIKGPRTGMIKIRQVEVDPDMGHIFATIKNNFENYDIDAAWPSPWNPSKPGFIAVYDITANGDVPPKGVIKGPASQLVWPAGVAFNRADREIYAVDSVSNALFTFVMPEFFKSRTTTSTTAQ